jgi:uncharacterized membrane protein
MPVMRRWIIPIIIGLLFGAAAYQSTLLATPYALMKLAMNRVGGDGKVNQFQHGAMATAANQPIVRPSPDLAYSNCVFDISEAPVLIDVAPVPDHYWSVSVFDARTDVAAVRSDRDTGGKSARLALVSKGQAAPAGYERVELAHARGIVLIRILLANREEFASVDAIRRQSTCKRG